MPKIFFILPIFNEARELPTLLDRLVRVPVPPHYQKKIVAVNDGSTDASLVILQAAERSYPLHLISYTSNRGIPTVFSRAFEYLRGALSDDDVVIIMESDGTSDLALVPLFLQAIADGADLVIGSRNLRGGRYLHFPLHRRLGSQAINRCLRLAWHIPGATDYTIFYRAYRGQLLRQYLAAAVCFDAQKSFAVNGELLIQLSHYAPVVAEVPLRYDYSLKQGRSKMKLVETLREYLRIIWLQRRRAQESINCPVCHLPSGRCWFKKNNHQIVRCRSCRLIFVFPVPTDTARLYSSGYFCGATDGFGYVDYAEAKRLDERTFNLYLDRLAALGPPPGRLLDVGAATGAFLAAAERRGWEAAGVEVSDYAAAQGRRQGLNLQTGTSTDIHFPPHSFDVITLWDVFEHLADPRGTLDRLTALLKPGGSLVLNLPDAGSWFARACGRFWHLILPPEHLHLYNRRNLQQLLGQHGWRADQFSTIGKRFTPAYILQVLSTVRHSALLKKLSRAVARTPLNKIAIPINLRDNMFVIARKES